jgi:hypothetical protein
MINTILIWIILIILIYSVLRIQEVKIYFLARWIWLKDRGLILSEFAATEHYRNLLLEELANSYDYTYTSKISLTECHTHIERQEYWRHEKLMDQLEDFIQEWQIKNNLPQWGGYKEFDKPGVEGR